MLPKEELYMPPLNIKVRDQRAFGRRPIVGNCVLKNLFEFKADPPYSSQLPALGVLSFEASSSLM